MLSIRNPSTLRQGIIGTEGGSSVVRPVVLPPLHTLVGNRYVFIRLAALSGASAIAVHLYFVLRQQQAKCRKPLYPSDADVAEHTDKQIVFQTANLFHFLHSLALLSVPLSKSPTFVS